MKKEYIKFKEGDVLAVDLFCSADAENAYNVLEGHSYAGTLGSSQGSSVPLVPKDELVQKKLEEFCKLVAKEINKKMPPEEEDEKVNVWVEKSKNIEGWIYSNSTVVNVIFHNAFGKKELNSATEEISYKVGYLLANLMVAGALPVRDTVSLGRYSSGSEYKVNIGKLPFVRELLGRNKENSELNNLEADFRAETYNLIP